MKEKIKNFFEQLFCFPHHYIRYDYKVIDIPEYGRKCEMSYLRCTKCGKEKTA